MTRGGLLGVAVGAGWQSIVAYINIGCYYLVGLPLGILLGFIFDFGSVVRNSSSYNFIIVVLFIMLNSLIFFGLFQ